MRVDSTQTATPQRAKPTSREELLKDFRSTLDQIFQEISLQEDSSKLNALAPVGELPKLAAKEPTRSEDSGKKKNTPQPSTGEEREVRRQKAGGTNAAVTVSSTVQKQETKSNEPPKIEQGDKGAAGQGAENAEQQPATQVPSAVQVANAVVAIQEPIVKAEAATPGEEQLASGEQTTDPLLDPHTSATAAPKPTECAEQPAAPLNKSDATTTSTTEAPTITPAAQTTATDSEAAQTITAEHDSGGMLAANATTVRFGDEVSAKFAEQISARLQNAAAQSTHTTTTADALLKMAISDRTGNWSTTKIGDGIDSGALKLQAAASTTLGENTPPAFTPVAGETQRRPLEEKRESSRAELPKPVRMLEKVADALKELSRSKDGKTITIELEPAALGHIRADVSLRDGTLHARLVAESPQVGQLLRERAAELQGLLRQLGLQVERVTVATGGDTFGDSLNEWSQFQGQQAGQHAGDKEQSRGGSYGFANASTSQGSVKSLLESTNPADHWVA